MSSSEPFANPSDRIKALCDAAMRRPDISVTEKVFESQFAVMPAAAPAPAPQVPVAAPAEAATAPSPAAAAPMPFAAAPEEVAAEPEAVQHHTEQDQELAAMLDERDQVLRKRSGRGKLVANVLLLLLFVGPVTTVAVVPSFRAKFEKLVQHLNEGMSDVKSMANTKDSYDEALKEVAVRGDQIGDATRALGIDPASVSEDDDLEMNAEMRQLMGDDADGFATRRGKLEEMGFVAGKLTGMEAKSAEEIRAGSQQ